jgi:hypothetical protein
MCICIEKVVPDLQLQQHISTTLATHWQRISNTVVPDLLLQQLLDQLLARVIFKHFFRPLVRERLVCHRLRACVRVCVCVCVCVRAYSTIYAISPLENMGAGGGGGGGVLKAKAPAQPYTQYPPSRTTGQARVLRHRLACQSIPLAPMPLSPPKAAHL